MLGDGGVQRPPRYAGLARFGSVIFLVALPVPFYLKGQIHSDQSVVVCLTTSDHFCLSSHSCSLGVAATHFKLREVGWFCSYEMVAAIIK